jgi:chromosome segregation ATPase
VSAFLGVYVLPIGDCALFVSRCAALRLELAAAKADHHHGAKVEEVERELAQLRAVISSQKQEIDELRLSSDAKPAVRLAEGHQADNVPQFTAQITALERTCAELREAVAEKDASLTSAGTRTAELCAELAALRETADVHRSEIASLEQQLAEKTDALSVAEQTVERLQAAAVPGGDMAELEAEVGKDPGVRAASNHETAMLIESAADSNALKVVDLEVQILGLNDTIAQLNAKVAADNDRCDELARELRSERDRIASLEVELQQANSQLAASQDAAASLSDQLKQSQSEGVSTDVLRAEVERCRAEVTQLTNELAISRDRVLVLEGDAVRQQQSQQDVEQALERAREDLEHARAEAAAAMQATTEICRDVSEANTKLGALLRDNDMLRAQLEDAQASARTAAECSKCTGLEATVGSLQRNVADLNHRCEELVQELAVARAQLNQAEELRAKHMAALSRVAELTDKCEQAESNVKALDADKSRYERQKAEDARRFAGLQTEVDALKGEVSMLTSRLQASSTQSASNGTLLLQLDNASQQLKALQRQLQERDEGMFWGLQLSFGELSCDVNGLWGVL